jgi:uncharacterized protein (UPF0332 family)
MSTAYSESFKIMAKAEEAIEAVEYNINGGFSLAATNRAYYACYYCMAALLLTQNVYAKTHQGVRGNSLNYLSKLVFFLTLLLPILKPHLI